MKISLFSYSMLGQFSPITTSLPVPYIYRRNSCPTHVFTPTHYTARKTIFSFSRRPEKTVFPKNLRWNMIFLVLSGKMIFLFPENNILHVRRKMKDDLF